MFSQLAELACLQATLGCPTGAQDRLLDAGGKQGLEFRWLSFRISFTNSNTPKGMRG